MTIIGAALTVGSTVAQYSAQQKVERARNDALSAERIRQKALDREAEALNLGSRERYEDFQGQQEAKAVDLGEYFAGQRTEEPEAAEALPTASSNIVVREEQKQRDKARDFTDQTGLALGNLRAFGDLLGGIGRETAQDASLIGQIGGFKRGHAGVLPLELDEASRAGNGLRLFGDILGGMGGLAVSAGLNGSPLGSAASAGVSLPAVGPIPTPRPLRLGSLYPG